MPHQTQIFSLTSDADASSLESLETVLRARLPHTLPVLRRLQNARHRGATTEHARVVLVSEDGRAGAGQEVSDAARFTVSYIDVSGGPETQMWLFSTLETEEEVAHASLYKDQLRLIIEAVSRLASEYGKPLVYGDSVILGTLHSRVRELFLALSPDTLTPRESGIYDKWLFRAEGLPEDASAGHLEDGMYWDVAREDDLPIVIDRTDIPRTPKTLRPLPSVVIRLPDGTPVAWSFLGPDGSLISVHCEPDYRRRGLAKRLAGRLLRQGPGALSSAGGTNDGWLSADVAPYNEPSRRMCKSLGGSPHWQVSWVLLRVPAKK